MIRDTLTETTLLGGHQQGRYGTYPGNYLSMYFGEFTSFLAHGCSAALVAQHQYGQRGIIRLALPGINWTANFF